MKLATCSITGRIRRAAYTCALLVSLLGLSLVTSARSSFTNYADVQQLLPFLTATLPAELNSSDVSIQRNRWSEWVIAHDREIRTRLLRGDEDTIANWLLFGTSFTKQPKALFDIPATSETLPLLISKRATDLIAALKSDDSNERLVFARRLLVSQGFGFETADQRKALQKHFEEEAKRIVAERQQYFVRGETFQAGDFIGQVMAEFTLFRDRGLSLDTSLLPTFAIDQALQTMKGKGLLAPNSIRRVAVIGPGLDFSDKNSGFDFYPVQTLQPFTTIDSLVRLGLTAIPTDIDLTTFDISPRVNDHILNTKDRAKTGTPYVLRVPADRSSQWAPALVSYWKNVGNRIGSEKRSGIRAIPGLEVREVEVRPQVAARITPVDFNMVTERWTGPPFDLVIATNVLVYYDKLDQALAFAAIESMLRPGGLFITNNAIVELPVSQLRAVGLMTVQHSPQKIDHVFWYRRNSGQ